MNILVLRGGPSAEHEVSLVSGEKMAEGLADAGHTVTIATVTPTNTWMINDKEVNPVDATRGVDLCALGTHGEWGEDGIIQGFLEALNVPYTGSGVLSSALAMDKWRSKAVLQIANIAVPDAIAVHSPSNLSEPNLSAPFLDSMRKSVKKQKAVIKPASRGSSVGITIAHRFEDIPVAIEHALQYDNIVLIEEHIDGREITCGIIEMEEKNNINARALKLTEIIPSEKYPFYDYDAKYKYKGSQHICPAKLPKQCTNEIQKIALAAFDLLECRHYARVDFILRKEQGTLRPYLLEVNTLPGMTPTSSFPEAAASDGITFPELMNRLVNLAINENRQ